MNCDVTMKSSLRTDLEAADAPMVSDYGFYIKLGLQSTRCIFAPIFFISKVQ